MLASISPLGERARASRWWLTITAYLAGSVLGGSLLGLLAAAAGSALPAGWRSSATAAVVVAALLLLGLLVDVRSPDPGPPSWRRQVDEAWLARYRGWVYGLGFGLQLGFGLVTIVTSTTVYAVVLLAALSGTPAVGLALGALFGLVRALPVLALRRVAAPADLHRLFARLEAWRRPADGLARCSLVAAAVAVPVLVTTAGG